MKIILLSDVKTLGTAGTVLDVKDGFANNFLFPRGLAAEASKGAMALLEQQRRAKARREADELANAQEVAQRLEQTQLLVSVKAGGNGRLFGAVTNGDVAESIKKLLDVDVDRHKIEVPENIKSLGSYPIEIRLSKNILAKTTVKVVAQTN